MISLNDIIFGSIAVLLSFYLDKSREIDKEGFLGAGNPSRFGFHARSEYDFIIVGSGSAGSVLANKLSQEFSVLLLESGGDPVPSNYVPANTGFVVLQGGHSSAFHSWTSTQQEFSSLHWNGTAEIRQGNFLGGSSVVNGLVYNRGHPSDYDQWVKETGDESWSYGNLIKYFQMSEDFYEEDDSSDEHLGYGGPLSIGKVELGNMRPLYEAFLDAGNELGYESYNNSNAPQMKGFGPISSMIRFGRRVSAYDAFLEPILSRETLTISRYSRAIKIDIDESNTARGVYYIRHGIPQYARATKEIILSAGTLSSPLILFRSGIGPEDQLKAAGIPVKADLPVGQNFQDHPSLPLTGKISEDSNLPFNRNRLNSSGANEYLETGKGPLTIPWGMFAQAFMVSSISKSEGIKDWSDIQILPSFMSPIYVPGGNNHVQLWVSLARGLSRGSISLDLKNITNDGVWDPRSLENERDLNVLAEGAKLAADILQSKAFQKLGISLDKITVAPSCSGFEFGSTLYWRCFTRQYAGPNAHPTGTCRMGREDDPSAVVDSKLRVKGVKGLRVIDNSIQPVTTNANTHAPALMIGQKGASMILEDYSFQNAQGI